MARCDPISDAYMELLCNGDLIGLVDIFWDSMGPLFPIIMVLIFAPGLYLLSGDLALPLTVFIFFGSVMGVFLPGIFRYLGVFIVAIAIGVGIFGGLHRLRRES